MSIPPPFKVQLNEHNIIDAERPILNAYRNDANSLHAKLKQFPVWLLMHDDISKFSTEYKGIYLKDIDKDLNPYDVPFCVTAYDITDAIIQNVIDAVHLEKNAYTEIKQYFDNAAMDSANYITPTPPTYLKFGTLLEVNEQQKEVYIAGSSDLPIAITRDGVASNVKAGQILRILYGFNSPDYRCAAHIASGVAKCLTTSRTMNVEEVTELQNVLRTITKHFESSIKNTELLDECLSILVVQPIYLISWCQTRMGYFF